ncbi:MAG: glycosyltransferase family 2 protein [Candidatus Sumerlaeia bacterium]
MIDQKKQHELVLVMPVYNEEDCIAGVVRQWAEVLERTVPDYKMLVLNDGSRDRTARALEPFANNPKIEIVDKPNSGHGPTILMGYRRAVAEGAWVFQTDSDDEMPAESFPELWGRREDFDFLFGARGGREQSLGRKLISQVSRLAVRLLFKPGVDDVNTPYRLMRAEALAEILPAIPDDAFAPNVIISGLCARRGCRIDNAVVPHRGRRTGSVSIVKWKLWKSAARALVQTINVAMRSR